MSAVIKEQSFAPGQDYVSSQNLECTDGRARVYGGGGGAGKGHGKKTRYLYQGHTETQVDLIAQLPPEYNHTASLL